MKTIASAAALTAAIGALAQAQVEDDAEEVTRTQVRDTGWWTEGALTYTDNYRRLPETFRRFDVSDPSSPVARTPVDIDPPSNVIATLSAGGTSFVVRNGFNGFVTGDVRVGAYLDGTDLDDQLGGEADPAAPFPAEPNAAGQFSTYGVPDVDDVFIEPNLIAAASARLSDDIFIDVSGLAQQQSIGGLSALSRETVGQGGDEITYLGGSISPYLLRRYDNDETLELRSRWTGVVVIDESFDDAGDPDDPLADGEEGQFANDSFSGESIVEADTGKRFGRASFGFLGRVRFIDEQGSDVLDEVMLRQASAEVNAAMAFSRALSGTVAVGYDNASFDRRDPGSGALVDGDLDGTYWNVGMRYEPSPRATARVAIGERYDGTELEADLALQVSPRVMVNASAERTLDTGTQALAGAVGGFQTDTVSFLETLSRAQDGLSAEQVGRSIAYREGGSRFQEGFRTGVFAFDRYALSAVAALGRTDLGAALSWTRADDGRNDEDETLTLALNASRALSRRMRVDAEAIYAREEEGGAETAAGTNDEEEQFYRVGLSYIFGRSLSGSVSVYHAVRDGNPTAASGTQLDYTETAVTAAGRYSF